MKGNPIKYRAGYKYQLAERVTVQLEGINLPSDIDTEFIVLTKDGLLTIKRNYAWDGCSGPTWDDKTNMRGGLFHDALYQLMRMGLLPQEYKAVADTLLKELIDDDSKTLLDDGTVIGAFKYKLNLMRAWYYYEGVDHFAAFAAKCGSDPYPIQIAP